jgi:hypothetical protein
VVRLVYFSVEGPFNKFYGINCRPKLAPKLLDRFFHRRRQVSPPVDNLTHRFFDGSQHVLYCNFTVGFRHCVVAPSSSRQATARAGPRALDRVVLCLIDTCRPTAPNDHSAGTSAGAPLSLIMNTRNFADLVSLAFRSTT